MSYGFEYEADLLFRFSAASQGTQDEGTLQRYRALYRGDRSTTVSALRAVYTSRDVALDTSNRESWRNFPILNELRVIENTRIAATPTMFDVACEDDEQRALDFAAWAEGRISSKAMSLYAEMDRVVRDQEIDGSAAVAFYPGEEPRIAVRDVSHLSLEVDPLTGEIEAAEFQWSEGAPGSEDRDQYVQRFDRAKIETAKNGAAIASIPHGLGQVPVALFPRTLEHGTPVGVSGVAELVDAYLHLLWTAYLLNYANKYEAFGVYCPAPSTDDGSLLNLGEGGSLAQHAISPGGLYPIPIQKVGGNISVQSIIDQYERALDTLYRLGRVTRDRSETTDMRSGKAMQIDNQDLRDYVQDKLVLIRAGLERLADFWAWSTGAVAVGEPSGLTFTFPAMDVDDTAEMTARAKLWLDAEVAGKATTEQRLAAWQALGMIDEDADIEAMAEEVTAKEDAEAEKMAEKFAADMQRVGQPAQGSQEPGPIPPPNGAGKAVMPHGEAE